MDDHQRLQPPPRIPAAGENPIPGRRSNGPDQHRRYANFASFVLLLILFAALAAVFLVLPRWQERQHRVAIYEATEIAAQTPIDVSAFPTPIPPTATAAPRNIATPKPSFHAPTTMPAVSGNEQAYMRAMSEGLNALEKELWQEASAAFEKASRLKPNTPEVADGLARVAAGKKLEMIRSGVRLAAEFEAAERWRDAEKSYAGILALDASAMLALTGRDRTTARAELDEKLAHHIQNPARLSSMAVFEEATTLLEQADAESAPGPRLKSQISKLQEILDLASRPIRVVIESDNLTDVVIYKVGRQGRFERRELDLRPGIYTVVGSRNGYRDVRKHFEVTAKSSPKPVVILCQEAL
jgi:hypothetical protein